MSPEPNLDLPQPGSGLLLRSRSPTIGKLPSFWARTVARRNTADRDQPRAINHHWLNKHGGFVKWLKQLKELVADLALARKVLKSIIKY